MTVETPKISIITVNLNNRDGLRNTIESVVSQTLTNREYIIIDGGSTDGSIDVIKRYAKSITYWVSELDKGIYNAMNKGIKQATGMYCLFLNSADSLCNNQVLKALINNSDNEDVIYGNEMLDGHEIIYPSYLDKRQFIVWGLCHQATLIKRELFDKIGLYDEQYMIASDHDFFIKAIIKRQVSYKHVNIPVVHFDLTGISNRPEWMKIQLKERYKVLKKYFFVDYLKYRMKLYYKKLRKWIKRLILTGKNQKT